MQSSKEGHSRFSKQFYIQPTYAWKYQVTKASFQYMEVKKLQKRIEGTLEESKVVHNIDEAEAQT